MAWSNNNFKKQKRSGGLQSYLFRVTTLLKR